MSLNPTITYYNQNAQDFVSSTLNVDFRSTQDRFLAALPAGASILDFGCGSGRDTKYFLERGYQLTATDGSEELCKLASSYTGIPVRHMLFQDLSDQAVYDGIWACSSILHLPYGELKDVLKKMEAALRPRGIVYTSFKYGTFEGQRNGRYFTDMTEEKFDKLLLEVPVFETIDRWVTSDVRPGRGEEKWLNLLLRKI